MATRLPKRWTDLALLVLLLVGLALRLYDLNWDENHHIHPDERFITMVAMDTWVPDAADALDPRRSALNPYWNQQQREPRHFAYGSFPLYLVRASATAFSALASSDVISATGALKEWRNANDYDHLNLVGRALSALFDTLTIGLVYLLARRVYRAEVGLLAAAFVTFAVQHLQLAHFYAFDVVTTTVVVAAVYFGIRVVQDGKLSDSVWLGAMIALAVASKFSALPLLLVIVLAHALRPILSLNASRTPRPATALGAVASPPLSLTPQLAVEFNRALMGIMLSLLVALFVYALVSPFTFLDFSGYTASISEQSDMVRGVLDYPYTRQYRNTGLAYWFDNLIFWGLGPTLGFTALTGAALVVLRALRRTAAAPELLMLAWVVPYGIITLAFQVKFLRYLMPLTPFLCIMAAYASWRMADSRWLRERIGALRYLPIAIVLVATILSALAFLQIYTQPLTRVQASQWIYRNVPRGSALTAEVWDDSLPFSRLMNGEARNQGEYKIIDMNLHEPDDARKLENLKQWLRAADYVVISSNRMYGWLPRLAARFPITKRYYDLLFTEQLGFKSVAQFTDYPRLGSIEFNDDRADESFTVYDHPKVMIYQKVRSLSDAEFNALFADTPPAQNPNPSSASTNTRDKSLLLDRPVDLLPAVNDRAWNQLANASQWLAVGWWWLVVELLGVLALPLTLTVFHKFADRGYIFGKSLGLLLVAYVMWLMASLHLAVQHALVVWAIALALLALAAFVAFTRRAQLAAFWRAHWRIIIFEEALFALAFLAFVFIRILNPDLWQPWNGGEKPMEFAFLNAILKSPYFPPYDPYFAGGYINYYYYGIYLVGVLIKLTGVASEVAFNLAIPTLFALTMVNAFSVAFNVAHVGGSETNRVGAGLRPVPTMRALLSGLLAALFIVALGNLDGFVQIAEGLGTAAASDPASASTGFKSGIIGVDGLVKALQGLPAVFFDGKPLPPFDYWRSSRVIPFTINEFPLWSFLFADLHPHMIGIPFTVLAIALAAHTLLPRRTPSSDGELEGTGELITPLGDSPLHVRTLGLYAHRAQNDRDAWSRNTLFGFVLALTLGAIAVINTWDAPTYLGLAIGVLLLRRYALDGGGRADWVRTLVGMVVVGALSILLYLQFFSAYKALYVGLGVADQHTDFQPFVIVWGFFLFVALTYVAGELARRTRGDNPARFVQVVARRALRLPRLLELQEFIAPSASGGLQLATGGLLLLALFSLALFFIGQTVITILIVLFVLSAVLLTRRNLSPRAALLNWLAFWAFAILLGVEVVYLQDFLGGGEWKRMNTLFKFYIQVWVLLSLLAAIALPELWSRLASRRGVLARLWQGACAVLVGASLIFTFAGTMARVNDRFPTARPPIGTLDGLAFMHVGTYNWPDERTRIDMNYDLDAIHWLQDNVGGTPVVAEANIGYYREGGLRVSSFTGLPTLLGMHQSEQRYSEDVGKRDGEAREFFNTPDSARAMELIRQLRIHYIYVGQLERVTYDAAGLAKFDQMRQAGVLDVAYQNPKVMIYRVKSL